MNEGTERLNAALGGRYTVERELGRGGMATVFLARDNRHDRLVALKVMHPHLAASTAPERFLREVRLAARLDHPHILAVLDSGESAGHLWYTMPYVEGESLRDRLNREAQLPLEEAIRITREVADALDYAHSHGAVHRDIKPENILLRAGHARVGDFGVARAAGPGAGEKLTDTGFAVGTVAYMSPEQASGSAAIDGRSDQYSLACMVYEMLAGETPFAAPTPQAVIAKRFVGSPPTIRTIRPDVPTAADAALTKALAQVPAARFGSTIQFAQAFAAAASTRTAFPADARDRDAVAVDPLRGKPHRVKLAFGALLIVVTAVLVWYSTTVDGKRTRRLAVLPFENIGDTADSYFASGMTDAVRGKLAGLDQFEVIARGSTEQVAKHDADLADIGRALGVDYLLAGTVHWMKRPGGISRVQLQPELVAIGDRGLPITRWQQAFDAELSDVFRIQVDIATRVAEELGLAVSGAQRQAMASTPTNDLGAYDAFLRGEAIAHRFGSTQPLALRRALAAYEEAVSLDTTFSVAWAQLSRAASAIYFGVEPNPLLAERARRAAERAISLAPGRVEGWIAHGAYFSAVLKDNSRALAQFERAAQIAPADAQLLEAMAVAEHSLGSWESALGHLRDARRLDPRAVSTISRITSVLLAGQRFEETIALADTGLQLSPTNLDLIQVKVMAYLGQGDLDKARGVLRAIPPEVAPSSVAAYFGAYYDLAWVLDEAYQQLLFTLTPEHFDNNRSSWAQVMAQAYWYRGDTARGRAYGDSASASTRAGLIPNDPQGHALYGMSLAFAGQFEEAIKQGEYAISLLPLEKDIALGAYLQHQLVRVYILAGRYDQAIKLLEPLLRVPYVLSPGRLRIDPDFRPLSGDARFRRLSTAQGSPH